MDETDYSDLDIDARIVKLREEHHRVSVPQLIEGLVSILIKCAIFSLCLVAIIELFPDWLTLLPALIAVVILIFMWKSLGEFAGKAERLDREYFVRCLGQARTAEDLEHMGLPRNVYENVLGISADELSAEWDAFGSHNEARERMLRRLHSHADLRKLADQLDEIEEDNST
jgi:hypothetical protein